MASLSPLLCHFIRFKFFRKPKIQLASHILTCIHTYLPMYKYIQYLYHLCIFNFLSNLSPSLSLKLPMHAVWAILTFDFMMAYALPQIIFRSFCTLSCWWRRYVRFRLLTKAPGQTDQAIWRSLWWTRALFCFESYDRVCLIDRRREGRERPQTEEESFFFFLLSFFP